MTSQYRILIPSEVEALLDAIEKERLRIAIETLLNTGARYSELLYLAKHLKIFDHKNNAITLPVEATKTKRERVIHLTPAFSKRLYQYLREHKSLNVPTARVMNTNLKRWWYNMQSILLQDASIRYIPEEKECTKDARWHPSVKTFRKTWESWLLFAKKEDGSDKYSSRSVAESMGHTELISYQYYSNKDPRLKSELKEVNEMTEGWGT